MQYSTKMKEDLNDLLGENELLKERINVLLKYKHISTKMNKFMSFLRKSSNSNISNHAESLFLDWWKIQETFNEKYYKK